MNLNQNETKLVTFLAANGTASIREIAKACGWIKSLGVVKADSRVRNALRRPFRNFGLVTKKARGTWDATEKARKLFPVGAVAEVVS